VSREEDAKRAKIDSLRASAEALRAKADNETGSSREATKLRAERFEEAARRLDRD
jgi:hypothetical protein